MFSFLIDHFLTPFSHHNVTPKCQPLQASSCRFNSLLLIQLSTRQGLSSLSFTDSSDLKNALPSAGDRGDLSTGGASAAVHSAPAVAGPGKAGSITVVDESDMTASELRRDWVQFTKDITREAVGRCPHISKWLCVCVCVCGIDCAWNSSLCIT